MSRPDIEAMAQKLSAMFVYDEKGVQRSDIRDETVALLRSLVSAPAERLLSPEGERAIFEANDPNIETIAAGHYPLSDDPRPKPTIAELEAILNDPTPRHVTINSDGSITVVTLVPTSPDAERIAELEATGRDNYRNAWRAINMIREAVEQETVGALPSDEAVLQLKGPEPLHAAEFIVEAVHKVHARAEAAEAEVARLREALRICRASLMRFPGSVHNRALAAIEKVLPFDPAEYDSSLSEPKPEEPTS